MTTIYKINNWESAPQIKNELYPNRKIDIEVYRDPENKDTILGYGLRVIEDEKVIYAFDVESEIEGHYSLSTDEAIGLLNQIGFKCEFDSSEMKVPEEAKEELEAFKTLGYMTIVRILRPRARLIVSVDPVSVLEDSLLLHMSLCSNSRWLPTGYVSPKVINYRNYVFLPANIPTLIDEILR